MVAVAALLWSAVAWIAPTEASAHPSIAPFSNVSTGRQVNLSFLVPFEPQESSSPMRELRLSIPPEFKLASLGPPLGWSQTRNGDAIDLETNGPPSTTGVNFTIKGSFTAKGLIRFPMVVLAVDGTKVSWDGSPPLLYVMEVGAGINRFGPTDPVKQSKGAAGYARSVGIALVLGGVVAMGCLFVSRRRAATAPVSRPVRRHRHPGGERPTIRKQPGRGTRASESRKR